MLRMRGSNRCLLKTYLVASTVIILAFCVIDSHVSHQVFMQKKLYETRVNIQFYKSKRDAVWHAVGEAFRTPLPDQLVIKLYPDEQSAEWDMGKLHPVSKDSDGTGVKTDHENLPNVNAVANADEGNVSNDHSNVDPVVEQENTGGNFAVKDGSKGQAVAKPKNGLPAWRNKPMFQNIYNHSVLHRMKERKVFYLSAVARNSTVHAQWDQIIVSGWEYLDHINQTHACCVRSANGMYRRSILQEKLHWDVCEYEDLAATRFVCANPFATVEGVPAFVAFVAEMPCDDSGVQYVAVDLPLKQPTGSIALCAKVAYGDFPGDRILEWMEINRYMGVDKVLIYTYNLTKAANRVLQYYVDDGFLIKKEFDYPMKLTFPRYLGKKHMAAWHDEQVPVYDCVETLGGYNFLAILDLDEFLVPSTHLYKNWKKMLTDLTLKNKKASGFSFHTEIFTLNWGVSNPKGKYFVTRYINRTRPMWDRKKNIIIPDRVVPGSVWTHRYKSVDGYQHINVSTFKANIKHYRQCRPHWIEQGTCMDKRMRYQETTMLRVVSTIHDRLIAMKELLGL